MPGNGAEQAIEVNIGPCLCPGAPHPDGDVVWMKPHADLQMGLAAESALRQASNWAGDNEAAVYSVFVRHGVIRWNCQDAEGRLLPVTYDSILDRLGWLQGGKIVALRGRELYQDQVFLPPPTPRSSSQPPSPSSGSTPRSGQSGPKRPRSPRPSSPSARVAST